MSAGQRGAVDKRLGLTLSQRASRSSGFFIAPTTRPRLPHRAQWSRTTLFIPPAAPFCLSGCARRLNVPCHDRLRRPPRAFPPLRPDRHSQRCFRLDDAQHSRPMDAPPLARNRTPHARRQRGHTHPGRFRPRHPTRHRRPSRARRRVVRPRRYRHQSPRRRPAARPSRLRRPTHRVAR